MSSCQHYHNQCICFHQLGGSILSHPQSAVELTNATCNGETQHAPSSNTNHSFWETCWRWYICKRVNRRCMERQHHALQKQHHALRSNLALSIINKASWKVRWAEARIKITRMTLTIKRDRNWSSFQLANSAPPLSVTGSAIALSARMEIFSWNSD